jgi:hypothetical protein
MGNLEYMLIGIMIGLLIYDIIDELVEINKLK